MSGHGRRATFWTRWPDLDAGPLWAGVHLHERAGSTAVVGVELFSEPPADAREALGPSGGNMAADLLPLAPDPVRAGDVRALDLAEIVDRFRQSSPEAAEMVASRSARGTPLTRLHLAQVARTVTECRAGGSHRTAVAVAARWHVSHSTAKKWIARARAENLLPRV